MKLLAYPEFLKDRNFKKCYSYHEAKSLKKMNFNNEQIHHSSFITHNS